VRRHPEVKKTGRGMSRSEFFVAGWKVEPQLHCLVKGETSVHLEPKVMQVLVELAGHAGEVLSKDDLIKSVWPNTFVGDDALIRCVSELRRVFEDDPRSPRVIQTISKVGYRLIAPVTYPAAEAPTPSAEKVVEPNPAVTSVTGSGAAVSMRAEPAKAEAAMPPTAKGRRWIIPAAAALSVSLLAGSWMLVHRYRAASSSPALRTISFTSYEGSERQPAFSPDGNHVAFSWTGEAGSDQRWNIYVKMVDSETPLRLTNANAADLSPAWSPDGKWIAFIRSSAQGNGVYIVPSIGGPERKIYDLHCFIDWDDPGISWSPDGKLLIFPDFKSQSSPSTIVSLDVATLQATKLTNIPDSWDGDSTPEFSPDGTKIAFTRGEEGATRNIYVMDANGHNPRPLTKEGALIQGLTWTPDGKSIVFSSSIGGSMSLWSVSVAGNRAPERLPVGATNAITPAISPSGDRLAYSEGSSRWYLMRVDLKSPQLPVTKLVSSTEQDTAARISPDGKQIAFQSWRSGAQEIWVSAADGTGPVRMTFFNGSLTGSPSWSPDGKQLAFDSRPRGWSHIFVMNSAGGTPRQVTDGDYNDIIPSWSHDGNWIYSGSKRGKSWQIWKVNVNTRELVQVTTQGGFFGTESPDGKWFYYIKYDQPGLWRVPVNGGAEDKVLNDPPVESWGFCLTKDGIYYMNAKAGLEFRPYNASTSIEVGKLDRMPSRFSSMTVSPDGRWLIYSDHVSGGNNLMMVENFR
jgi:Tol biopolymer transport system component/DNA-binding winged helix-turn-helix (wHTH) protein